MSKLTKIQTDLFERGIDEAVKAFWDHDGGDRVSMMLAVHAYLRVTIGGVDEAYVDAMIASNEAGFAGMTAGDVIRHLSNETKSEK